MIKKVIVRKIALSLILCSMIIINGYHLRMIGTDKLTNKIKIYDPWPSSKNDTWVDFDDFCDGKVESLDYRHYIHTFWSDGLAEE